VTDIFERCCTLVWQQAPNAAAATGRIADRLRGSTPLPAAVDAGPGPAEDVTATAAETQPAQGERAGKAASPDQGEGSEGRRGELDGWDVEEVCEFFRRCELLSGAREAAVRENRVNGRTLAALTDAELMEGIAEGGLGLSKLQLKRVRVELACATGA
jgi:hypothetical protein